MTDRKEIIRGLDAMREFFGYGSQNQHPTFAKYQEILTDTISLIKEQEPVKPVKEYSHSGVTWWYICGSCRTVLNPNYKYCYECGRPLKWK